MTGSASTTTSRAEHDAAILMASLPPRPPAAERPVFVLMSGLPGTGKSYFSRKLAASLSVVILETDALRRVLVGQPTHSAGESRQVFQAVHLLLECLLAEGRSVLLDATNLVERHRKTLYGIADRHDALLVIVRMVAPEDVVRQRLSARLLGNDDTDDNSDAGEAVYERMRRTQQPVRREHMTVDSARDVTPAVRAIVERVRRWRGA